MEAKLRATLPGGAFHDVPPTHSKRMAAIRGKGNRTTERRVRAMLVSLSIRGWKVNPKGIVGKPDFYFPDDRIALFVDGCFWHGCPRCCGLPRVNRPYW